MTTRQHQILATTGLGLCTTGLVVGMLYLVQAPVTLLLLLALLAGLTALLGVVLEILLYRPARQMQRSLRQMMLKDTQAHPRLRLSDPRGNPLTSLYGNVLKVTGSLRMEYAEMREIEAFRREFLGDVSHELKTPIFAIQGFIETLLDGALEDKRVNRKFLRKALRNVFRLEHLVKDLLTISQLETGELKMEMSEFKIYDVVLDVFDQVGHNLRKEGREVELILKTHNLENQYVLGDRDRIRQVVENLVSNAIKYGRDEGGEVEVSFQLQGVNGHRKLMVYVRDNGAGIAEQHLPHIFTRFYRVDKSRSREKGGTGLGLSIVRSLLEAHGESIEVKSTTGEGTTFSFSLKPVLH